MGLKNQDVLLSVKPQYANLLVDGIKSVELRRKFPESLPPATKCLIYSTSPEQMIIGECQIGAVEKLSLCDLWAKTSSEAMIPWDDFNSYFEGKEYGYAVHMYGYTRYKEPKSLGSITGINPRPPQSYRYIPSSKNLAEV